MWNAVKMALGLAPVTMECTVTVPAYDPKYRPAKHVKVGDRVIYRAGVFTDRTHPLEGKTGTVESVREPCQGGAECDGFYVVPVHVIFDDPASDSRDNYGGRLGVNSRNIITLTDWLVEREKARAA